MIVSAVGRSLPLKIRAFANDHASKGNTKKVKFAVKQRLDFGKHIAVVGNKPAFGSWDPSAGVHLCWEEGDLWAADVEVPAAEQVELKFVIVADDKVESWLPGDNILLSLPEDAPEVLVEAHGLWSGKILIKPVKKETTAATSTTMEPSANGAISTKTFEKTSVPTASSSVESNGASPTAPAAATTTTPAPAKSAAGKSVTSASIAPVDKDAVLKMAAHSSVPLAKLTLPKLKVIATELGLKTSGKKAELIARIEAAQN